MLNSKGTYFSCFFFFRTMEEPYPKCPTSPLKSPRQNIPAIALKSPPNQSNLPSWYKNVSLWLIHVNTNLFCIKIQSKIISYTSINFWNTGLYIKNKPVSFLVYLSWKLKWAILITSCASSPICLHVNFCLFTSLNSAFLITWCSLTVHQSVCILFPF